jgi:hypothetical protein
LGEFICTDDVNIHILYTDGELVLTVTNLGSGQVIEAVVKDNIIGGTSALISGTSYVPDAPPGRTPDLRCGAYLRNLVYTDFWVSDARGFVEYPWWSDSPTTYFQLIYGDDMCTLDYMQGVSETINIDYTAKG